MMLLKYKIQMISDASPSSGFGTEFVDSLITRNFKGQPIIRASHIKGLMRQTLSDTMSILGAVKKPIVKNIFGSGNDPNTTAQFALTNALLLGNEKTLVVSKTKINRDGTSEIGALRTSEFISVGSEFFGECYADVKEGSIEDHAIRLSLLAIDAIGGSRTRGAGSCIISIENENRTPGFLLKTLIKELTDDKEEIKFNSNVELGVLLSNEVQLFKVIFKAETPVCCPEMPVKTNLNSSGFSIPASAVQGAILHRLNKSNPKVATACFESSNFRTWPLQPTDEKASRSIRVSLTHKVDKNAQPFIEQENNFWFSDKSIQQNWQALEQAGAHKSSDGVLLNTDEGLKLWKDSGIPRVVSIHNKVAAKSDGLFSIESIAPITWFGYLVLPKDAAEVLVKSVNDNNFFSFGKKRSVQGGGKLSLEKIEDFGSSDTEKTILITQSPLLFNHDKNEPLEDTFLKLVKDWAKLHRLPEPITVWADAGIRFGWNRHTLGKTIGEQSRLQAVPVILPGAVIKFDESISNDLLQAALIAGIGEGKQRGYGAVLVHPGVAKKLFKMKRKPRKIRSGSKETLLKAIKMGESESLPSASQLNSLLAIYKEDDKKGSIDFLKKQKKVRGIKYYSDWSESFDGLLGLLNSEGTEKALNYLMNVSIARRKEN